MPTVQFLQFVPSAKLGTPFALPHSRPAQVSARHTFLRWQENQEHTPPKTENQGNTMDDAKRVGRAVGSGNGQNGTQSAKMACGAERV
jgi:hypothetical protein